MVDEMEKDFQVYHKSYCNKEISLGRNMNGRTPYRVSCDGFRELKKQEDQ
ncbi:hypothetical protein LEP1GSC195_1773 [Leptospira wolbachii serovar Codice str. CDC]|uniref:Uncharacterized protein n=1 Tax=Leptospira wolbachii serovar Codice str. CDC TaxID=1218599 RepID=R9A069_9LEPT|nr:hypothetical protein LEP1GSC195_1773 [Leptospira wolbachii serovar Codice str. CDC]